MFSRSLLALARLIHSRACRFLNRRRKQRLCKDSLRPLTFFLDNVQTFVLLIEPYHFFVVFVAVDVYMEVGDPR